MDALPLLLDWLRPHLGARPFILGVAGAQGSGKSMLAARVAATLSGEGRPALATSLDDFYLPRSRRLALAARVHPLLATRGVPGTHDLPLLLDRLEQVKAGQATSLPRFDKLADDRLAPQHWTPAPPLACLILEGWCIGARAQPLALLADPVNGLEATEDADGRWRRAVNAQLAGAYQRAWARLDGLALLAAPDWDSVPGWRAEQEAALARAARRAGLARPGMDAASIARFCAHYERLTRWQLATTPARAGLTLWLDRQRRVRRASKSPFS
jgi:D-glycerate 3-kinase